MPKKKNNEPSSEQITQYLLEHPDFFNQHEGLLAQLKLPHSTGQATSLIERQVSTLRKRNTELRHRLNQLIGTARENDLLFEKTRTLVLDIISADSLEQLTSRVQQALEKDFAVDVSALTLFTEQTNQILPRARMVSLQEAKQTINGILSSTRAVCGNLRPQELSFLFREQSTQVASAAVAPLESGEMMGVLALGSFDPGTYQSTMGTLFLDYVGDALKVALPRFVEKSPS